MKTEVLIERDDGQVLGVAQGLSETQHCPGDSTLKVGRILFHLPTLGCDPLSQDLSELLRDETFVIFGRRWALASHLTSWTSNGSVLIVEDLKMIPEWRPKGSTLPVPARWMAL